MEAAALHERSMFLTSTGFKSLVAAASLVATASAVLAAEAPTAATRSSAPVPAGSRSLDLQTDKF